MRALILNSGLGMRMGDVTKEHPKCMTELLSGETILGRQLKFLCQAGISDVVITTGYFDSVLMDYCGSLGLPICYTFIKNPLYDKTNYIYSIFCAKNELENQDILLVHGDLVFEYKVLEKIIGFDGSCMKISSTQPLPPKDFKAVIKNNRIEKIGIEFFGDNAVEAQALYKLQRKDWQIWLNEICVFCHSGRNNCYAENAFNSVSDKCIIYGCDVQNALCTEIDTTEDLTFVNSKLVDHK